MKMRIRISPESKKVLIKIKHLGKQNAKGIRNAFYKLGKNLKATAKENILKVPRSGNRYLVSDGKRIWIHTASVPGETPANLFGNLARSLSFKVSGSNKMEFGYRQAAKSRHTSRNFPRQTGVSYGKALEEGTNRVAPRPGLLISIKANEANALEHFNTELKKELTKK